MAQFTIRIDDDLRDRIRDAAAEDKRSMNGEIEWLLDAMLAMRSAHKTLGFGPDADMLETAVEAARLRERLRSAKENGQ
jgi:hypothetical protein